MSGLTGYPSIVPQDRSSFRSFDRLMLASLIALLMFAGARAWLDAHPEHDPWSPLHLEDPDGWATRQKLASLRTDPQACRAVLERSEVPFTSLDPVGEGACRRMDRLRLEDAPLAPSPPPTTCAVAAAFERWMELGVQALAGEILGSPVARIEHLGAYSCRRLYGRASGNWSEHATGNAIDISAFVLEDGRRITLQGNWFGEDEAALFLKAARNAACENFGTVLSPDYNAAHADHFHLDQQSRGFGGVCR